MARRVKKNAEEEVKVETVDTGVTFGNPVLDTPLNVTEQVSEEKPENKKALKARTADKKPVVDSTIPVIEPAAEDKASSKTIVQVLNKVQAYTRPNFNASSMSGTISPGAYEVTDIMNTISGKFLRLGGGKYILEGPYAILQD